VDRCSYPPGSTFSLNDWNVLANYWHPVAESTDVNETTPFATRLLDVNLVLYRLAGGLCASVDLCPHRGTRLSLGRINDGNLICPYHGLQFDARGVCVKIPGSTRVGQIPDRFRITSFLTEERYGLVWVCLSGHPAAPLPDWSAIERDGNQRGTMQCVWNASAARHVENFNDIAHFSIAHADTFGDRFHPRVMDFEVRTQPHGLSFAVTVPLLDGNPFTDAPRYGDIRCEYNFTFPYASRLTLNYTKGIEEICDAAAPVSAGQTRIFILKSRDHDQDQSHAEWIKFQNAVNEEDRLMVESQWPVTLPLGARAEWHLGSDKFSVAFRKYWLAAGMG
jgi:phenylpropionate dioxygenase-like ring-hydroxylating dioxygenase large terminal subunit